MAASVASSDDHFGLAKEVWELAPTTGDFPHAKIVREAAVARKGRPATPAPQRCRSGDSVAPAAREPETERDPGRDDHGGEHDQRDDDHDDVLEQ